MSINIQSRAIAQYSEYCIVRFLVFFSEVTVFYCCFSVVVVFVVVVFTVYPAFVLGCLIKLTIIYFFLMCMIMNILNMYSHVEHTKCPCVIVTKTASEKEM